LKAIQKEKSEKIKEIFKELWLKYGDYKRCVEEFKKIGIDITIKYLRKLRCILNLPKKHVLLKNKKCFYCGKTAERITYKCSPIPEPISICKKCYLREKSRIFRKEHPNSEKLAHKKYYKKHRIEILRKRSALLKSRVFYICLTICPICGTKGKLNAQFIEWLTTKHKTGPYFFISHRYYDMHEKREKSFVCYAGKDQKLFKKYSHYLPLCNCKKCKLKRGEINESNTEEERI
jgi:hypothetical protein